MKAIVKPIATLGVVVLMGSATMALAEGRSGEEVYSKSCKSCHDTGAAGAPKVGDAGSWGDRLDKDKEELYENAINGVRAMPPKGTCSDCSKDEIRATVDYMLSETE